MIIDLRVYTYLPSKFRKFLKGYQDEGFALTSRHLGKALGIFTSESGVQNRTFQFFMYDDSSHRYQCRVGMRSDPAWTAFIKIDGDALLQQHNSLLEPLPDVALAIPKTAAPSRPADAVPRIFELLTFTCFPGDYRSALELVRTERVRLLQKHGIEIIGAFTMNTGDDNNIVMMCVYQDDLDRDVKRSALQDDPAFQEHLTVLNPMLRQTDTTLLLATPYSPLQ